MCNSVYVFVWRTETFISLPIAEAPTYVVSTSLKLKLGLTANGKWSAGPLTAAAAAIGLLMGLIDLLPAKSCESSD